MGKTLGDCIRRYCQGMGQLRDSIAHSRIVEEERGSKEPSLLGCKGDSGIFGKYFQSCKILSM